MIGFAGLSHLGIVYSAVAAARGYPVVAYDPDGARCEALAAGTLPLFEPGLADLIRSHRSRIRYTSEPGALAACDLALVSLDTPTNDDNRVDLTGLRSLVAGVFHQLPPAAALVILSQVPPGFTRALAAAHLNQDGGRGVGLYCQVETLVLGHAVERALSPERFIVGCADPAAPLPPQYQTLLSAFGCPILRMPYESAEVAKVAINVWLASCVTVTNTLGELCESLGGDWSDVAAALRLDARIGARAYLAPGLGIAGGNLERDLVTVSTLAREHGTDSALVDAILCDSRYRREWALRVLQREVLSLHADPVIAVWGLAYKAGTSSIKNSPALALIEALGSTRVRAHDPEARVGGARCPALELAASPLAASRGADVLMVMTPWPEFGTVDLAALAAEMAGHVIIDPFGVLDRGRCLAQGFRYCRLGAPPFGPGALG